MGSQRKVNTCKKEPQHFPRRKGFQKDSPTARSLSPPKTSKSLGQARKLSKRKIETSSSLSSSRLKAQKICSSKLQPAWQSLTRGLTMRSSLPEMRWQLSWSSRRARRDWRETRRDGENSKFSDSLMGLMQRTGRYDWMELKTDHTESRD